MESRYKYREYRPASHRLRAIEQVGHQIAYTVRTDILIPEGRRGRASYLPRCSCGWKCQTGQFVSMRQMMARWDRHMVEVSQQGTLPLSNP